MKKIVWMALVLSSFSIAAAQDIEDEVKKEGWTKGGVASLNFSQVALSNWAAGGENSFAGVAFFQGFANYVQGRATWDNTLNLGYGLQKQGEANWFKTNDKLEFASKYGFQASENWFYSGLLDFKTQFYKGYESVDANEYISNFFAPAYLSLALGMDYKPSENLSVLLSPLSSKFTFVTDTMLSNKGAFGVEAGKHVKSEFGAFVKIEYKRELMKNINYATKLDLFSNYLHKPQNIDVNWDNLLTFKINDYFNASLMFNMIYDDDIEFEVDDNGDGIMDRQVPKLQWKEMFGIGLSYTL